jgi:hypothetical protein
MSKYDSFDNEYEEDLEAGYYCDDCGLYVPEWDNHSLEECMGRELDFDDDEEEYQHGAE